SADLVERLAGRGDPDEALIEYRAGRLDRSCEVVQLPGEQVTLRRQIRERDGGGFELLARAPQTPLELLGLGLRSLRVSLELRPAAHDLARLRLHLVDPGARLEHGRTNPLRLVGPLLGHAPDPGKLGPDAVALGAQGLGAAARGLPTLVRL